MNSLTNVMNIFKNEINGRCPLNMKVKTNLKEVWETNEKFDYLSFIECICLQMKIMEMLHLTFYAISMEDICIIDCDTPVFFIISNHLVSTSDHFTLSVPPVFQKDYLHFPDLIKVKRIPCTFHKSSIYYTLGLILFSFYFKTYPVWNNVENIYYGDGKVMEDIEKIRGTKIYFFLKRCFQGELFFI